MFTPATAYDPAGTILTSTGLKVSGDAPAYSLAFILISGMANGNDHKPTTCLGIDLIAEIVSPENSHLDFTTEQLREIDQDLWYCIMLGNGFMTEGFTTQEDAERAFILNAVGLVVEQAGPDDLEEINADVERVNAEHAGDDFINSLLASLGFSASTDAANVLHSSIDDAALSDANTSTPYEELSPAGKAHVDAMRLNTAKMLGIPLAQVIRAEEHYLATDEFVTATDSMFVNSND